MRSLISVSDLTRQDVETILGYARGFKEGLSYKIEGDVALLFLESSTRTKISFEKAARLLGLRTYSISGQTSSMTKGESFYDTLKTLELLGFKGVVFRVPFVLYPYKDLVDSLELSLVNAGDGTHQHPTQGLIDLFTLRERFGSLESLKVLYVGDILHSRVFRSGAALMKMFDVSVAVCGPATLIPKDVKALGVERVFKNVDEGIDWADVVVWLRLQKERQKENYIPSERSYFLEFGLTWERYKRLKGLFMHPGPVNREVDIAGDLIYSEKSLIEDQVRNGLFVRMAVLRWCLS